MRGPALHAPLLLVDWSPRHVRVYDPASGHMQAGASISEAMGSMGAAREAIAAINQRSAFVRALPVPKAAPAEIRRILEYQLEGLLPLNPSEYVFDFRLGGESRGTGPTAVLGAVKIEALRRLESDARAAGLKVRAVVPLAFGSWLAARGKGITEGIVVETDAASLSLDVIHGGELWHSRSIPHPESPDEFEAEVERTFRIVELERSPVVSSGCPGLHVDILLDKDPIEHLASAQAIEKQLFSLALPESIRAARARSEAWKARRSVAALVAAVGLGAFAVVRHLPAKAPAPPSAAERTSVREAKAKEAAANKALARAQLSNRVLNVAFDPGQTFGDALNVLTNAAGPNAWFTSMSLSRTAPLSISGLAMTDADVARISAAISSDRRFQDAKVVSLSRAEVAKKPLAQFMVVGKLRGMLAFDRPPKVKKKA